MMKKSKMAANDLTFSNILEKNSAHFYDLLLLFCVSIDGRLEEYIVWQINDIVMDIVIGLLYFCIILDSQTLVKVKLLVLAAPYCWIVH